MGRGELRVTFAGSADFSMSTHAGLVERRTHVHLEGPGTTDPVAQLIATVKDQVTAEGAGRRRVCFARVLGVSNRVSRHGFVATSWSASHP